MSVTLRVLCDAAVPYGTCGETFHVASLGATTADVARRLAADAGWMTRRQPNGSVHDICPGHAGKAIRR